MKYLITQTDVYRCDNEREAEEFLKLLKSDYSFEVVSSKMEKRELKSKGEVIDEWIRLTVKKKVNDEKEPYTPFTDYVQNDCVPEKENI